MAGAGACRSIFLRSVAVALLLSQVSALPSMLPELFVRLAMPI
jgi:hypothetical protein